MANVISSNQKSRLGICLTLDAFGTLYHPKRPIAVQYLEVARRCGLKANIQVPELEASFRKSFKDQSTTYPNYGKSKGMSVESWWDNIVYGAFHPLCRGHTMPASLGSTLFQHFSSRDAYALYPDVLPFFHTMQKLRQKYSDPKGPIVLVGIITNSDNRARTILKSLGLQVGPEWEPESSVLSYEGVKGLVGESTKDVKTWESEAPLQERKDEGVPAASKSLYWYNSTDDINFMVTSYATGYEKPDIKIFHRADDIAANLPMLRLEHGSPDEAPVGIPLKATSLIHRAFGLTYIHVGDDFDKDYQGAKKADRQALHLCRNNQTGELEIYQISDLLELATCIELMADTNFTPSATNRK